MRNRCMWDDAAWYGRVVGVDTDLYAHAPRTQEDQQIMVRGHDGQGVVAASPNLRDLEVIFLRFCEDVPALLIGPVGANDLYLMGRWCMGVQ